MQILDKLHDDDKWWACDSKSRKLLTGCLLCTVDTVLPVDVFTSCIDGIHSIFSLWQLEGKGSCDVDIDQSADSMVM